MLATIGSISHGTLRAEDLLETFADELERLDTDKEYSELIAEARKIDPDSEDASYIVNEDLPDALQSFAPDYVYFGTHPGDGSDFGFWPDFESIEFNNDEVQRVSDHSEIDGSTPYAMFVNDHGNVTFYRVVTEIKTEMLWDCV